MKFTRSTIGTIMIYTPIAIIVPIFLYIVLGPKTFAFTVLGLAWMLLGLWLMVGGKQ